MFVADFQGLMTIGSPTESIKSFDSMVACRDAVAELFKLDPATLQLSMGMSGDMELAIERGSTEIRVGSAIFGERDAAAH